MRPWSYSRLGTYACPARYKYQYVDKVPSSRAERPAADRGSMIHQKAEDFLLDKLTMYPPELQKVAGHAMGMKARKACPEIKVAVREDWTPCDWDDPDTYFRGIIDAAIAELHRMYVYDWKTGQVYDSHKKQIDTYIALAAAAFPDHTEFHGECVYIDQGERSKPRIVPRSMVKGIRIFLDAEIKNAESDTVFPTRAGPECRWCDYAKKYGGPCQFG